MHSQTIANVLASKLRAQRIVAKNSEATLFSHYVSAVQDKCFLVSDAKDALLKVAHPSRDVPVVVILSDHYTCDAQVPFVGRFIGRMQVAVSSLIEKEPISAFWNDKVHQDLIIDGLMNGNSI